MRRRGDDHGIETFQVEQSLVLLERLRAFALLLGKFLGSVMEMLAVDVADRDNLRAAGLECSAGITYRTRRHRSHPAAKEMRLFTTGKTAAKTNVPAAAETPMN